MLLASDPYEDLSNIECVAVALMSTLQATSVLGPKLDAPKADRVATDCDASFGQEILNISMTQVETKVQPNGIADDFKRESMAFVGIHPPMLAIMAS